MTEAKDHTEDDNKNDETSTQRLPAADRAADDNGSEDRRPSADREALSHPLPAGAGAAGKGRGDADAVLAARAAPVRRALVAPLALLLAILALLGTGYLWWEGERAAAKREQAQASLDDSLAQVRSALENQASVLEQLARHDEQVDEAIASRGREIDALNRGLRTTGRALEERSGLSSTARDSLLRTEIEQYLRMANRAVQLAHDPVTALAALRVADERLRAMDDPAYTPVREQVAGEIAALEALPQIDVTGIALRLGRIARRVDDFPLASHADRPAAAAGEAPAGEPGFWSRTWVSVRGALNSLVSVRRTDEHAAPLLAPDQEYFLRENLRLQLETARLALLRGDEANFAASLRRARAWLMTYFDTEREHIVRLADTFETLAGLGFVSDLPDLSGSLNALRVLSGDNGAANTQGTR